KRRLSKPRARRDQRGVAEGRGGARIQGQQFIRSQQRNAETSGLEIVDQSHGLRSQQLPDRSSRDDPRQIRRLASLVDNRPRDPEAGNADFGAWSALQQELLDNAF